LKKNGAKDVIFRLSTMLLKNNELYLPLHDVDEKKGSYCKIKVTSDASTGSGQAQWRVKRKGKRTVTSDE